MPRQTNGRLSIEMDLNNSAVSAVCSYKQNSDIHAGIKKESEDDGIGNDDNYDQLAFVVSRRRWHRQLMDEEVL